MELDERKKKILHAIIRNYLETGEPVGSRTISKDTDLHLSSATIRNEMADLEEMGLIMQPHTSSGRIPSDKGYRLYVDTMLEDKTKEIDELKELLLDKEKKTDELLQQVAKLLAVNTNYTTVISAPSTHRNKLKFIQLSRVDEHQILAVIVAEGNVIRNSVFGVDEYLDDEALLNLNMLLNTNLSGMSMEEINLGVITALKQNAGIHSELIAKVLDEVAMAIKADEGLEIYTSGANNIFKYPELSDHQNASRLITTLEEKHQLSDIVEQTLEDTSETGIQVYIGEEAPMPMKDCSVVTATYELGQGMRGTIGIIGPKRMDYEKVVGSLKTIKQQLEELYKEE
ncbi:MAG: heat-inducible transcriptional repressor HrcA [Lachnospiraceae bacterium]|nr:heat-inducible transcriptional repressor HrcA [Lachnospiraceae bacterium]